MSRRGAGLGRGRQRVATGRFRGVTLTTLLTLSTLAGCWLLSGAPIRAQVLTLTDVSPDSSNNANTNSASGGRVNGVAIDPASPLVMYAASEFGGIYKSTNGGTNWLRLNGHRPTMTWDVKVDPSNSNRIYATSLYDGRSPSLSGINVSTDGGVTWTHPATAVPPAAFCAIAADQTELSAFGIDIDPTNTAKVYIGTSCGLAISTNSGVTWTFSAPVAMAGDRMWDLVVASDGSYVDTCGDSGHMYLDTSNGVWGGLGSGGLPSGVCSIAASPYATTNLFAVAGTKIYESTDGFSWAETRTNPGPQGRVPFVKTNKRSLAPAGQVFDLWFGDTSLYRVPCDTAAVGPKCGTGTTPAWSGPYSNTVGGHNDLGAIAFNPAAANDACPMLHSSDGGVYANTLVTSPACHDPVWLAPTVTPHGLWPWSMGGADLSMGGDEHLYFGNQDNGVFGSFNVGAASPTWVNDTCCDVFDTVASDSGTGSVIYSFCCFSSGRASRITRKQADFSLGTEINYPATGLIPAFQMPDAITRWGDKKYAIITADCTTGTDGCPGADGGLYITQNIEAVPIVWTELGNATEPQDGNICGNYPPRSCQFGTCGVGDTCFVQGPCAVYSAADAATFYVQTGACDSNSTSNRDQMWKFTGTAPGGAWTLLALPGGEGFGVFAVDPADPNRLLASGLSATDATVYFSTNGGTSWSPVPDLNTKLRGGGDFPILNSRGSNVSTNTSGYFQPSLLAFDPIDHDNIIAGGRDSGILYSENGGTSWNLVTDPRNSHTSGIPHIPRPRHAYFSEADHNKSIYVSSQGRGIWRLGICTADAFEPDEVGSSAIGSGVPQNRSICGTGNEDWANFTLTEKTAVTIETSGATGDTILKLFDINGTQIDFDDDGGAGLFSRITRTCASGSVLLPGTYFIVVGEYEANDTIASYQLSFTATPCCGNGAVDPGEGCDDANRANGDCCSAACVTDPVGTACNDANGCTASDVCKGQYLELFDGVAAPALPGGWTTSGTGNLWTTTAASSDSPPNSATTDDPVVVADKRLDSPPIAITSAAELTFRNRYDTESTFDGSVLEIKIGAGAFQDIVTAGGAFSAGGYNAVISTLHGNPIGGRQAWSGNSGGFVTTTVSLPAAALGQTVVLRWRLASDTSVGGAGQHIDTVRVRGGGASIVCAGNAITAPPAVGALSAAANKQTYTWPAATFATSYDVVRGGTALLPVGPGGGSDEACFNDLASPTVSDAVAPAVGAAYWYLTRGGNTCGVGPYGNGVTYPGAVVVPRATTTCP